MKDVNKQELAAERIHLRGEDVETIYAVRDLIVSFGYQFYDSYSIRHPTVYYSKHSTHWYGAGEGGVTITAKEFLKKYGKPQITLPPRLQALADARSK